MTRLHLVFALTPAVMSLLACAPERTMSENAGVAELENVEWMLIEVDGTAAPATERKAPTLTLSSKDHRAHGFAGCNRFTGGYELNGDKLRFTALATTRMACAEPTREPALLKALEDTASWRIEGRTLELLDASSSVRARWTVTAIEKGGQS